MSCRMICMPWTEDGVTIRDRTTGAVALNLPVLETGSSSFGALKSERGREVIVTPVPRD